jgi:dienelactone hydrolase
VRLPALLAAFVISAAATAAPEKLFLWPEGAPGAMPGGGPETVRISEQGDHVVTNVHRPSLTVYLPEKRSGVSVIVVPGGGHRELWTDHEGHNVARFLSERGIAAFVLQYRLARAPNSTYSIDGDALNDLKRAIRTVRSRADWAAETKKIGAMGFSAGGALVSLAATRADGGDPKGSDPIERAASSLDFAALVYPGSWPDLKIDATTPPMWLLSGSDDRPDIITGLTSIFVKLRESTVPAELHFYDHVGHGFGLRATLTGPVSKWPQQFVDWLKVSKFVLEGTP